MLRGLAGEAHLGCVDNQEFRRIKLQFTNSGSVVLIVMDC